MNTIIFFFGLLLIILSSIAIMYNKKSEKNIIKETVLSNYTAGISSYPEEKKARFDKILDAANDNKEAVFIDEKSFSDSFDKESSFADVNTNNIIDYREEVKGDIQNYSFDKIIELSNSGLKAEEIAKITSKGIREVEIILRLQNKKSN
ncbi:hypothetical protein [Proteiniborus sp. MB09-C3]|uniref:hypothetical protein n=1 Tax=Proteiniborus sp. MB09-C3 TaxID=3050072 RepID=UPI00255437DA|nr:hypothetical protein [Proteiniborus sp. MB09-C3]WIV10885.1 hypothetical protein QO263_12055 [Proteiniborus sp. MB09-C3]